MSQFNYTDQMLVGFSDGDGGWSIRVLTRQDSGTLGFSPTVTFTQAAKNRDVIDAVQSKIEVKPKQIRITKGKTASGNPKSSAIYEVFLTTKTGKNLLAIFEKYPPIITSHYESYLICLEVLKFMKQRPSKVIDQRKDRVESLGIAWLAYRMSGKRNSPLTKDLDIYYTFIKASDDEIEEGEKFGQSIYAEITKKVNQHKQNLLNVPNSNLKITGEYIAGYHIADGSFSITITFTDNNTKYAIAPYWRLHEHVDNEPCIEAIRNSLGLSTYVGSDPEKGKGTTFKISNWDEIARTIFDILSKVSLPQARKNQFEKMRQVYQLIQKGTYKTDKQAFKELIKTAWEVNDPLERTYTLQEMYGQVDEYFKHKNKKS